MAGGMLTKQADFLTAKFLNDVNDTASGGVIVSVPAGAPSPAVSQTIPGDRIVLDDVTALALSDTAVGTLFGGIYMYVQTLSSSAASPARGAGCFYRAADLPPAFTPPLYQVTADAQPSAAVPSLLAGVFINAITKGNFGWIQVCGVVSCLFDTAVVAAAVGNPVSIKVSPTTAASFDVGVASAASLVGAALIPNTVGLAIVLPVVSTITAVLWTRSPLGRI